MICLNLLNLFTW